MGIWKKKKKYRHCARGQSPKNPPAACIIIIIHKLRNRRKFDVYDNETLDEK